MPVEHRFQVEFSEAIVEEAARAFFKHVIKDGLGWKVGFAAFLLATSLVVQFVIGDVTWLTGVCATTLMILAAIIVALRLGTRRRIIGTFRRMKSPRAEYVFRENDFSATTELGSITLPWSTVTRCLELSSCFLLILSNTSSITLPTRGISAEGLAFVRAKLASPASSR
jgi:hypothetical protein